ncbi:MAG: hypothetical protein ACK476_03165 [Fluviicola sp.]|jgi:hypothetical protein
MKLNLREKLIVINVSYFQQQSKLEYSGLITTPFIVLIGGIIHKFFDYKNFNPLLIMFLGIVLLFIIHYFLKYITKKQALKYAEIIAKHRNDFGMHKIGLIIFITLISILIGWLLIGK